MKKIHHDLWLVFLALVCINLPGFSQVRFGPKAAIQTFIPMYSDAFLSDSMKVVPMIGYNFGIAMDYKINKRFSFYSELAYSRKGKQIKGGIKDMFSHVATYNYLELPVMLRVNFKGSTSRGNYDWYLSGGGLFSYWISGKGTIKSFELEELARPDIEYRISYKQVDSTAIEPEFKLHLQQPNRIQAGLTFETGVGLNFKRRQYLLVGLRYTYRQSWLARDFNVDVGLGEYKEDFRTLEHVLSLSASWLFEWNIGEGRRGKSTVTKRKKS